GAEHGHRGPEADARGPRRDAREHDLGRAHGEVGAVVLADAEEVDPDLVGELGLLDDVADRARAADERAVGSGGHVAERVEAQLARGGGGGARPRRAVRRRVRGSGVVAHRLLRRPGGRRRAGGTPAARSCAVSTVPGPRIFRDPSDGGRTARRRADRTASGGPGTRNRPGATTAAAPCGTAAVGRARGQYVVTSPFATSAAIATMSRMKPIAPRTVKTVLRK